LTAERRYLNLNAYLRNSGYHEAAWRLSPADPASVLDPRHYLDLAKTAERGVLDSIFLPDSPGVAEFRSEYLPGAGLDPLQLLSSVATMTEQVGLIATVSTTYSYPWDVARRLATLDFLSGGRAGWNIVTTAEPAAAGNFGDQPHPPTPDRYDRAGEYVEVVLKLWDAWEDDAAVMSRQTGQWADPAKLHPPRHHGHYFDVSSYLPFPRSPQGHPFLTQAGSSPQGIALAAGYADAVFTALADIAAGVAFRQNLRSQAAGYGRDPDQVRVLPGLSFLLAGTDAEAAALKDELEEAASSDPSLPGFSPAPPRPASAPRSTRWLPKNRPSRSGPSPRNCPPCPAGWTSPAPRRVWPSSSPPGGTQAPPTGSPSCRTSCPAS
jgi:FMN-dependent oxidoreductase (nitrilotriacetate monooxygenase family)